MNLVKEFTRKDMYNDFFEQVNILIAELEKYYNEVKYEDELKQFIKLRSIMSKLYRGSMNW